MTVEAGHASLIFGRDTLKVRTIAKGRGWLAAGWLLLAVMVGWDERKQVSLLCD